MNDRIACIGKRITKRIPNTARTSSYKYLCHSSCITHLIADLKISYKGKTSTAIPIAKRIIDSGSRKIHNVNETNKSKS